MGINSPSDIVADLSIAPTDQGMARLFVSGNGILCLFHDRIVDRIRRTGLE